MNIPNRKINPFTIAYTLYDKFSKKSRRILIILLFLIILSGLLDIFSISSVIPFIVVITEPAKLWDIKLISNIYGLIGLYPGSNIILPTTILFVSATFISSLIRIFTIFLNTRFAAYIGNKLNLRVFNNLIYQSYQFYLNKNTSELIASMTIKLNYLVSVIYLILNALSAILLILFIFIFLLIYQTKIALFVGIFVSSFYALATYISDKRLNYNSKQIAKSSNSLVKVIQETIGSIREIILMSRPSIYKNEFSNADNILRIRSAENQFISIAPKYLIESLGIFIIAFIAYYFNLSGKSSSELLTVLGTFALAAQRLIPSFQTVYSAISKIRSYGQSVQDVLALINLPLNKIELNTTDKKYKFLKKIVFENVSFSYDNSREIVLKNVNISIQKGQCIGIKGATGSGKSTLISLLIGLLSPSKGMIKIDEISLYSNNKNGFLQRWRNSIALVSQDPFLIDDTLLGNIAFGCNKNEIDFDNVEKAASLARIDNFIKSTENGYYTFTGERGIRLSGGQKQRIAIARALYRESEVLILDEATSQLDKKTESQIINSIKSLKKIKTIIMIAHRENTLEYCDEVYSLENKNLK